MNAFSTILAIALGVLSAVAAWFVLNFIAWLLPIILMALAALACGVAVFRAVRNGSFTRVVDAARARFTTVTVEA